jgi:hypothetical protein
MIDNLLNPVVLFFILGAAAGLAKADLKMPAALYETLSLYLLLAIGMKGGVELSKTNLEHIAGPIAGAIFLGLMIPLLVYGVFRRLGRFSVFDSAAMAAHYGSVSAVTFAVSQSFLSKSGIAFESFCTVLLVVMEIPAIMVGIFLARLRASTARVSWKKLSHEVFLGKSILLLAGGLGIAALCGEERMQPLKVVFFDPFKGVLAFFLLEMGLLASARLRDLRKTGLFLIGFGILMPIFSAFLACWVGKTVGLSLGGTTLLAVLAASASYIAAPAAVRIAIPEANPSLYLTASLGVTFPFNIVVGIPLYFKMAQTIFRIGG